MLGLLGIAVLLLSLSPSESRSLASPSHAVSRRKASGLHRGGRRQDSKVVAHRDDHVLRGMSCILGGALAHLAFGSFYCWGNFISYSPFHLRFFDGEYRPGVPPDSLIVMPFFGFLSLVIMCRSCRCLSSHSA